MPKLRLAAMVIFSLNFMLRLKMKTHGKRAKKKSATMHVTGGRGQQTASSAVARQLTSEQHGKGRNPEATLSLDTGVVQRPRREALCPEQDGYHDRDGQGQDADDPESNLVPQLHHDAQEKETQRDLGCGHSDHGEGLTNHLPFNGPHGVVKLQRRHGLTEAVAGRDLEKDGVEEEHHLE